MVRSKSGGQPSGREILALYGADASTSSRHTLVDEVMFISDSLQALSSKDCAQEEKESEPAAETNAPVGMPYFNLTEEAMSKYLFNARLKRKSLFAGLKDFAW